MAEEIEYPKWYIEVQKILKDNVVDFVVLARYDQQTFKMCNSFVSGMGMMMEFSAYIEAWWTKQTNDELYPDDEEGEEE